MENRDKKEGRRGNTSAWAKHLRKVGKKQSNKATRKAARREATRD